HTLAPAESASIPAPQVIPWLDSQSPFPPVESALAEAHRLLAAGGDLSPARIIEAYRHGIYPWYSRGEPLLWWSPDPRMVLHCEELKVSRSLGKSARNKGYEVRIDTSFEDVLKGCAVRAEGTWLGSDMRAAYSALHRMGYAHSF